MSRVAKEEAEGSTDGVAAQSYCSTLADFYSPAAREMMGRTLASFLDQLVITPGELIHSGKYLKRLNDSGRALMNAVDKVATLQARHSGENAAARLRDLNTLISAGTRKAWEDDRDRPVPAMTPETFLSVIAALKVPQAERMHAIGRVVAEHLFIHKVWRDKVGVLVQLVELTRGRDEYRMLEPWLAEALRSEPALDQMLGFPDRLEDRCHDLIDIWRGTWQPRDTAVPVMADIARLIAEGDVPTVKSAIEFALLRTLAGKEPLRSAEPEIEIQAVFDMFRRMWNGGQLVGGTKALALLERRQSRYLNTEGVTDLLRERKVVADRIAFLMQLAALAVGAANRLIIKTFIDHYFGDQDFVPRTIAGLEPPVPKLQTLAGVHRALKASWLSDEDKATTMAKIEAAQVELLKRARLFEQIEKKGGGAAQKVLTLLDLCRKNTFIDGAPLDTARAAVQTYLTGPQFTAEYLTGAQGEERERKIQLLAKTLASIGIDWSP